MNDEELRRLKNLCANWRKTGNGHMRLGRGYPKVEREKALKAIAQCGIYRICATQLETALQTNNP